jgi:hypothetical protein
LKLQPALIVVSNLFSMTTQPPSDRWALDKRQGIVWNVAQDERLPHADHIEMSGRKISLIVRYRVNERGHLALEREVIWPMLRHRKDDVRGYLRRTYGDDARPEILADGSPLVPGPLALVRFDGVLTFEHEAKQGLAVTRLLYPHVASTVAVERWQIKNVSKQPIRITRGELLRSERDSGVYGEYLIEATAPPGCEIDLGPNAVYQFELRYEAYLAAKARPAREYRTFYTPYSAAEVLSSDHQELERRKRFVRTVFGNLRLETPDPVLNRAFDFAKLRAAESVFETKMGLVHSPGGGRYYGGVWANDQAEYSGPFFPFLGEKTAVAAALNAYRIFSSVMTPAYELLPSSFEVEGDVLFHAGGDRGDAAMVAYGASRYALASGTVKTARELWPVVEWCLEYCRRKTNAEGVVESDTDELEGRFPTGKANLSTSTLAYGALRSAADLARALNKPDAAAEYDRRADALQQAIESYFGATVEGFPTYRYYDGNDILRAWICLPLTMGILDRAEGTIAALFSPRLWTADGLATQAGEITFWDRSTLYALRGVFAAGAAETALRYLTAYTHRRLLGDHVPYPVEAYPEGGQAHLSAESALYCRIITEGLFGIAPTGLHSFRCLPRLPEAWSAMHLRAVRAFGTNSDITVEREGEHLKLTIATANQILFSASGTEGAMFSVTLK